MTTTREALPQRRASATFGFEHWGMRYVATLGFYPDGRLGEVFVECGKSGTQTETLARDSAVLLSLAIQHGVPLAILRGAVVRDPDGCPTGPVGALLDLLVDGDSP